MAVSIVIGSLSLGVGLELGMKLRLSPGIGCDGDVIIFCCVHTPSSHFFSHFIFLFCFLLFCTDKGLENKTICYAIHMQQQQQQQIVIITATTATKECVVGTHMLLVFWVAIKLIYLVLQYGCHMDKAHILVA